MHFPCACAPIGLTKHLVSPRGRRYVPGRVETVAAPQYWVVRLQAVVAKPDASLAAKLQGDGRPGSLPPLVRVQWLSETADGSRLYKVRV